MTPADRVHTLLQIARLEREAADMRSRGEVRAAAGLEHLAERRRAQLAEDGDE